MNRAGALLPRPTSNHEEKNQGGESRARGQAGTGNRADALPETPRKNIVNEKTVGDGKESNNWLGKLTDTISKLAGAASGVITSLNPNQQKTPTTTTTTATASTLPDWLLPAGIGLGAIVLVLLFVRR